MFISTLTWNITDKDNKIIRQHVMSQTDFAFFTAGARHCIQISRNFHKVWEFIRWANPLKNTGKLTPHNEWLFEKLVKEAKDSQAAFKRT